MADDPIDLDGLVLDGERVVGVELDKAQVVGARIVDSDVAGVVLTGFSARRIDVARTRFRDCIFSGGLLQDVTFADCPAAGVSMRFSKLQRVTFSDCGLTGADFYGATFEHVIFERCDLSGAHFDTAAVKGATFRRCEFVGVTGALNLRGATIDFDDLQTLAPSLAREAGIAIAAEETAAGD